MTRKDFINLATTLRTVRDDIDCEAFEKLVRAACAWCHHENPRFNEATFRAYIERPVVQQTERR